MGFKCAPQLMGLHRSAHINSGKKLGKHRASGRAICEECGEERITNSVTYDESLSQWNRYLFNKDIPEDKRSCSGRDMWDYMEERANSYRMTVKGKGGTIHERPLRADAVIGCAIIFNPPSEVSCNWSDEEYKKFYSDSHRAMHKICPDIFRSDNFVFSAEHFDEGYGENARHQHRVYECMSKEGKYCGNMIDSKLLSTINKEYPKLMRSMGWDMEDLNVTDWDKYKNDEEYKASRNKSARKSGRNTNAYAETKVKERMEEAKKAISEALKVQKEAEALMRSAKDIEARAKVQAESNQIKEAELEQREANLSRREAAVSAQAEKVAEDLHRWELLQKDEDEMYKRKEADYIKRLMSMNDTEIASRQRRLSKRLTEIEADIIQPDNNGFDDSISFS